MTPVKIKEELILAAILILFVFAINKIVKKLDADASMPKIVEAGFQKVADACREARP